MNPRSISAVCELFYDTLDYLETKLESRGIDKITPTPDDVETPDVDSWEQARRRAVGKAIREFIDDELSEDLVATLADADDRIKIPEENERPDVDDDEEAVCDAVQDELADRPPESWKDINRDVVDDREEEAEEAQDEFAEGVQDAVREIIQKRGFVEVTPPNSDTPDSDETYNPTTDYNDDSPNYTIDERR